MDQIGLLCQVQLLAKAMSSWHLLGSLAFLEVIPIVFDTLVPLFVLILAAFVHSLLFFTVWLPGMHLMKVWLHRTTTSNIVFSGGKGLLDV